MSIYKGLKGRFDLSHIFYKAASFGRDLSAACQNLLVHDKISDEYERALYLLNKSYKEKVKLVPSVDPEGDRSFDREIERFVKKTHTYRTCAQDAYRFIKPYVEKWQPVKSSSGETSAEVQTSLLKAKLYLNLALTSHTVATRTNFLEWWSAQAEYIYINLGPAEALRGCLKQAAELKMHTRLKHKDEAAHFMAAFLYELMNTDKTEARNAFPDEESWVTLLNVTYRGSPLREDIRKLMGELRIGLQSRHNLEL